MLVHEVLRHQDGGTRGLEGASWGGKGSAGGQCRGQGGPGSAGPGHLLRRREWPWEQACFGSPLARALTISPQGRPRGQTNSDLRPSSFVLVASCPPQAPGASPVAPAASSVSRRPECSCEPEPARLASSLGAARGAPARAWARRFPRSARTKRPFRAQSSSQVRPGSRNPAPQAQGLGQPQSCLWTKVGGLPLVSPPLHAGPPTRATSHPSTAGTAGLDFHP